MLRQQEHHRDHSHHHYHYEGCEQEELHGASNTPLLSPTQRLSKTSLPARSKLVTSWCLFKSKISLRTSRGCDDPPGASATGQHALTRQELLQAQAALLQAFDVPCAHVAVVPRF